MALGNDSVNLFQIHGKHNLAHVISFMMLTFLKLKI